MRDYQLYLKKKDEAVRKYCNLPLRDFIKSVLEECGDDLNRLENVYIDEIAEYPSVWGCYKEGDKYVTYYTNEYAKIEKEVYDDPKRFMNAFLTNSTFYSKFPIENYPQLAKKR
ncbi:MAG: hypothetical protein IJO61_00075 [Oscillospiraceae bacterium]|nr:hypothetical protein [Oscillospiraceae bacterium]MBQ7120392.1 hypothetical protein [Oscillospiraceae bacterium]